ncbi:MAG: hypothetical protein WC147_10680 [Syntrophomonas sp.]
MAKGPILRTSKRDPSSPAAPQDDIYDTFSVVSDRPGSSLNYKLANAAGIAKVP